MAESDNIDIEEHDVMENPLIKKIFPDLSVVKQEIQAYFDEGPDVREDKNSSTKKLCPPSNLKDLLLFEDDVASSEVCSQPGYPLKPEKKDIKNVIFASCSKIILGTKPNKLQPPNKKDDTFIKPSKQYYAKICLQDVKSYLKTSNTFCDICLTLFPRKCDFTKHNKNNHEYPNKHVKIIEQAVDNSTVSFKSAKKFLLSTQAIENKRQEMVNKKSIFNHIKYERSTDNGPTDISKSNNNCDAKKNCFHCDKVFDTQQLLIDHLYNILQPQNFICDTCDQNFTLKTELENHISSHKKNENNGSCVTKRNKLKNGENQELYVDIFSDSKSLFNRCSYCSCYFKTFNRFSVHLSQKHKIKISSASKKKCTFGEKCMFCILTYNNVKSYNEHVRTVHRDKYHSTLSAADKHKKEVYSKEIAISKPLQSETYDIDKQSFLENTQDNLVLKSIVFKCSKCDVHFLSAKDATCHSEHIEILINWKCSLCSKIFKENDKALHGKQHLYSESLTVYDLSENSMSRVFYKCLKCAVHFTERNFLFHFPICGLEVPRSTYCKICDILIDGESAESHDIGHKRLKYKASDFIALESEVLMIGNSNSEDTINKVQRTPKVFGVDCDKLNNKEDSYIEKSITIKSKSNDDKECHKKAIKRKSDLNDDLQPLSKKTKNSAYEMSYCDTCKCFIVSCYNRMTHKKRKCISMTKLMCKFCALKFNTKSSFKFHVSLHHKNPNLKLQDFTFYNITKSVQIRPPVPEFPKCNNCNVHFIKKDSIKSHWCHASAKEHFTCLVCQMKFTETAYKFHMPFHYYYLPRTGKQEQKKNIKRIQNTDPVSNELIRPIFSKSDSNTVEEIDTLEEIVYVCISCNISIQTYDFVVEHCHNHFSDVLENNEKKCEQCGLKFEEASYEMHKADHNKGKHQFKLLKFDVFYFLSDNEVWIEHIFKSLNQDTIDWILKNSIYAHEKRIKMTVVQEGPSHLTMYKCNKCRCFIEPSALFMHSRFSCKQTKSHPCSICGLPLISSIAKRAHESIHNNMNVGIKSYKIVLFNKEEHKVINDAIAGSSKYHVLYQCRNCNGIVDRNLYINHDCNVFYKTCSTCRLQFHSDEYDTHIKKHEELTSYIPSNMKIILLGTKKHNSSKDTENKFNQSFYGITCDYTFYECLHCKICVRTIKGTRSHVCTTDSMKACCEKCGLYYNISKKQRHMYYHENDIDLTKDNINIIPFSILMDDDTSLGENDSTIKSGEVEEKQITVIDEVISKDTGTNTSGEVKEKPITNIDDEISKDTGTNTSGEVKEKPITSIDDDISKDTGTNTSGEVKEKPITNIDDEISKDKGTNTSGEVKEKPITNIDDEISKDTGTNTSGEVKEKPITIIDDEISKDTGTKYSGEVKEKPITNIGDEISKDKGTDTVAETILEKTADLFKCKCELHFLKMQSLKDHIKSCGPKLRKSKQTCWKCNLIFTPKDLFAHLISHHGNKNIVYKFNIVEVDDIQK